MNLDRSPFEIASAAAEEIRALNHRTLDDKNAYPYPSTVNETNSALKSLAERLPQGISQLREGLERLSEAGHIRLTDAPGGGSSDVSARVTEVREKLREAEVAADLMASLLERVGNLTCDMAYDGPFEDDGNE